MSKKLEKSELTYIKDLLDDQTKNWVSIGQKYQQRKILEAQMNSLVNTNNKKVSIGDANGKLSRQKCFCKHCKK